MAEQILEGGVHPSVVLLCVCLIVVAAAVVCHRRLFAVLKLWLDSGADAEEAARVIESHEQSRHSVANGVLLFGGGALLATAVVALVIALLPQHAESLDTATAMQSPTQQQTASADDVEHAGRDVKQKNAVEASNHVERSAPLPDRRTSLIHRPTLPKVRIGRHEYFVELAPASRLVPAGLPPRSAPVDVNGLVVWLPPGRLCNDLFDDMRKEVLDDLRTASQFRRELNEAIGQSKR